MLGAPELSQGKTLGSSGSLGPARRLRGELSEVLMSEVREGLAKKSCFAPLLLSRLARRKEGGGNVDAHCPITGLPGLGGPRALTRREAAAESCLTTPSLQEGLPGGSAQAEAVSLAVYPEKVHTFGGHARAVKNTARRAGSSANCAPQGLAKQIFSRRLALK